MLQFIPENAITFHTNDRYILFCSKNSLEKYFENSRAFFYDEYPKIFIAPRCKIIFIIFFFFYTKSRYAWNIIIIIFLQKFELRNHKTYIFRRKIFEILLLSFVSFFFSREKLCFLTFIGEDIARLRFSLSFYALTVVSS